MSCNVSDYAAGIISVCYYYFGDVCSQGAAFFFWFVSIRFYVLFSEITAAYKRMWREKKRP